MQGRKISKRLAVFLASLLTIAITGCIGFAFATTMTSQAATEDANTKPMTDKAGLASVITIVGGENGSETIDTSVTLSHAQFLMTPINENDNDTPSNVTDDTFEILVNPKGTATAGNGILLSFDPYEDGDGTKSIMYCIGTKKFYKAVVDDDEADSDITQGNHDIAFMLPLEEVSAPSGWENATKDITYNKTTGVISIKDTRPYRYTGITVYNFVTNDKISKTKTYYGALTETVDGKSTIQKLNSSTNKVVLEQDGKESVTGYLMNLGTSQLNGVLNQMKCNGGEEGFLSYQVNSVSLYSIVTNSANKVVFAVKLEKGSDFTINSDNTIVLSDSVLGDKILVISDVSPATGVQNPVLIGKAKDSLTFAPAVNHIYKLYASADAKTPIATITKPTDGAVKFTGLNPDTIYYIQYVLKMSDGTEYPSQVLRYKTASATEPTAFHFKKGETYDVMVSVGNHWSNPSNAFNIQGGHNFSLGHTLFNASISYFWDQDPRKEAVAQLSSLFAGRSLQVSCITPGAGYSTGNSKWGFAEVVEADEHTGRVTLLVYMSGSWKVNGRSIQNVAGNITATTPTYGRIAIQKKTMTDYVDIVKHNDIINTNYTLAGATFEVFYASDLARTNPVDILITDDAGEAESTDLPPGDYVVVESLNPKGYHKLDDRTIFPVTVVAGQTTEPDNPIWEEPERATFKMKKTSTDPKTVDNDYYSFEGIEYTLTGQNFGHTYTIKLDRDGNGSASNIAYDVYDLRETKTNKWYKKHGDNYDNDDVYNNISIDAESTDRAKKPVEIKNGLVDEPEYIYIQLNKKSTNPAITAHNTDIYSLLGAKYKITCHTPGVKVDENDPTSWLPKDETDNIIETGIDKVNGMHSTNPLDGYGRSVKLYIGDYEVKEISGSESKSFALDPVTYYVPHTKWGKFASDNLFENVAGDDVDARTYTVKQEDKKSGTCTTSGHGDLEENPDVDFSFYIDKHDDLNDGQIGEGAADLSAIFEVRYYNVTPSESTSYNSEAPFDVWYLKTDSNGKASFDDLLERNADGSVKTVSGPSGDIYGVGKTFEGIRAENGNTAPYKYEQNKVNASTGNKFQSVKNNNGRIYVKRNSAGELHAVIPVGIVEIEEVVAPEGYRYESGSLHGRDSGGVDDNGYPYRWTDAVTPAKAKVHKIYNREVTSADSDYATGRFDTVAMDAQSTRSTAFRNGKVSDHIYRSDIQVQKVDGDSSQPLAYIPFLVTSETTGEQHVIVMNEQGYYNSESSSRAQTNGRKGYDHSYNTNINDKLLSWKDGTPYISDPVKLNYESGTYFFGYGPNKGADKLVSGADPYVNLRNMMFNADGTFRVSDGAFPYDNYIMQEIRIPAFDKNGKHYKGNENLTLQSRPFSISLASMTSSPYEIDDWEVSISTTATDSNGSQIGAIMGDTVTITDTVTYNKLDPGTADAPKKYVMTGTLMDRKTGQPLTYEGKTFTVSKEFTPPSAATHSIALDFVVPSAAVMGTSTVVYEECKLGIDVVATHKVLEDEFQTVSYPVIHTTATDSVTDDHYGQVMNETITVVDKVKCEGLLVGKTYSVSGTLMDKATGADLKDADGNTFTATTQFVCDSVDQTVEITFEVPRSVIAGKTVVAFESVHYDNTLVGIHADINDEDQTVTYPDIHTTATDNVTGMHVGCDDYAVLINDVVKYDNLVLDGSYELTGTLMDKATGESLKDEDGNEITAYAKFVAGQKQEILPVQVPMQKTISADKKTDDKDKNDSADADTPASISPAADNNNNNNDNSGNNSGNSKNNNSGDNSGDNRSDNSGNSGNNSSGDNSGNNTPSGNNPSDGDNSSDNNGNGNGDSSNNATDNDKTEQVAIEYKTVTPNVTLADPVINGNYASGEVLVSFVVPRSVLEGKTTVVFEELEYVLGTAPDSPDDGDEPSEDNKVPIAEHEDINDEGQSVHYPMIHTLAHNNADVDINKVIPALAQIRGIWDELEGDKNVADALSRFHIIPLGTSEFTEIDILALFDKDACADRDFNDKPITYDEVTALLKAPEATYNPIFDRNNKQAQINMEDNTITFVDVIEYENLLVGETYVAEGVIMDKATESPIIDGASNQEVRASVEFVPETPNGTVEVEFTFDATAIGLDFTLISANMEEHKDIVVFEEMKIKGNNVADELITVARHQDINDYNQTMAAGNFPADELVETGTEVIETVLSSLGELAGPLALVFAANAAALIYIMRDRRRKEIV